MERLGLEHTFDAAFNVSCGGGRQHWSRTGCLVSIVTIWWLEALLFVNVLVHVEVGFRVVYVERMRHLFLTTGCCDAAVDFRNVLPIKGFIERHVRYAIGFCTFAACFNMLLGGLAFNLLLCFDAA